MRVPRKKIIQLVNFVARFQGLSVVEVDVAVVTSREISSLNRRYLNHTGPTDVISFDLSDSSDDGIRAQIVVCGELAVREGRIRRHGPQRELMLYIVHGLLHLMGFNDKTPTQSTTMHAREEKLLAKFLSGDGFRPGGTVRS